MYLHRIGILGANSDVNCVFCRNDRETVSHVLLCCTFSWRVWSHIIGWWGVSWVHPGSVVSLISWWTRFRCNNRLKAIWRIIPLAALWSLWKQRNEIIFNESQLDFEKLCDLIKTRIALWFRASRPSCCYSVDDLVFNLQNTMKSGCQRSAVLPGCSGFGCLRSAALSVLILCIQCSLSDIRNNLLPSMLMGFCKIVSPLKLKEDVPFSKIFEHAHLLDLLYHLIVPKIEGSHEAIITDIYQEKGGASFGSNSSQVFANLWSLLSSLNVGLVSKFT
ncbi:hypothetical protein ACSBR2_025585 [Camellia fascicularis]